MEPPGGKVQKVAVFELRASSGACRVEGVGWRHPELLASHIIAVDCARPRRGQVGAQRREQGKGIGKRRGGGGERNVEKGAQGRGTEMRGCKVQGAAGPVLEMDFSRIQRAGQT